MTIYSNSSARKKVGECGECGECEESGEGVSRVGGLERMLHISIDQSYVGAMVGISSASAFYCLHRNPKMLMAKSWNEFGELADNSRYQKFVWGFPAYHAVMLAAIL